MARIVWTEPALNDLDAIADFIALDKPLAARLLVQKIFKKVALLKRFPRMGMIPPELKGMPYRHLVIFPCRVFYRVSKEKVFIVAVLRGERRMRKEFLERH